MRIRMAPKASTAILLHRCNIRDCRTYWQEYGVPFISSMFNIYVCNRKMETEKRNSYVCTHA
jgi:hypothetical protein